MCSPIAHYTTTEAAETLSRAGCADGATTCAAPRMLAHAVGATHYDADGRKAVWASPCTRCGGAGVVKPWGVCFRCGGCNPRTYERSTVAISTIYRDLVAIAAGRVAPSIAADRRRETIRAAKRDAEIAQGVAFLSAHFPALVETDANGRTTYRAGIPYIVCDIAERAADGISDAQRAIVQRESDRVAPSAEIV
jgi:hypothetical protein